MLSGELSTWGQLEQHSKGCRVDGHDQRGHLTSREGFDVSHLSALSGSEWEACSNLVLLIYEASNKKRGNWREESRAHRWGFGGEEK